MRTSELGQDRGVVELKTVDLTLPHCKNCAILEKKIKELEAELDKHRCPICGRIGCMSDHGYDGGGPDWG